MAANIVIADNVPTNHTFTPLSVTLGMTQYIAREGNTAMGNPTLSAGLSLATSKRATNRIQFRLNLPREAAVDGVYSLRSTARYVGEIILPDDFTSAERAMFAALVANFHDNALLKGYVADLAPIV